MKLDLYEYYGTQYKKPACQCSACGVAEEQFVVVEYENLCAECYDMHLDNIADALDEQQTLDELGLRM